MSHEGNPFLGPQPYRSEDKALFFGRGEVTRLLADHILAYPCVTLYGPSGSGKSSLMQAGVIPLLRSARQCRVVHIEGWLREEAPVERLARALVRQLALEEPPAELSPSERLDMALELAEQQSSRPLLIYLDQLEQLFQQGREQAGTEELLKRLRELVRGSLRGLHLVMAMREDYLGLFRDRTRGRRELMEQGFRLGPLTVGQMVDVACELARQGKPAQTWEPAELSKLMLQVRVAGQDETPEAEVQAAFAQIVCRSLWEERSQGRAGPLEAQPMLHRYLEATLEELGPRKLPARDLLEKHLVARDGSRTLLMERQALEETKGLGLSKAEALEVLARLENRAVLRAEAHQGGKYYELGHDWLATKVLEQRKEREERREQQRQRWGLSLAALFLLVLCLAALYGGLRLHAYLEDERFVAGQLSEARKHFDSCRAKGEQARLRREEALVLFDGRAPASEDPWSDAERRWEEALALYEEANKAAVNASQSLNRALERAHDRREALQLLAQLTYERLLLAEEFHRSSERRELEQQMEQLIGRMGEGGAPWHERLAASAELELVTEPPGARVELERYLPTPRGAWGREPLPALGLTPVAGARLPVGSYLLRITVPDRAPVTLPLLLTRGAQEGIHLVLPSAVPEGYVYIPPGCSLLGTDAPEEVRRFMGSSPLHRLCLDEGYLIGRTEVTFGDWLDYLKSLPPDAPARHILENPNFATGRAVSLRYQAGAGWIYSFHRSTRDVLTAREGEPFHHLGRTRRATSDWRRFPLAGVSAEDLVGYFYWLERSGRLPGARLCTEHEWERAARGADGRAYPHGDRLLFDEANIDTTYGRQAAAFGPDEVGSFPASTSPFGLADMAGNVLELTRPVTPELGRVVQRGGSWYFDDVSAMAANRVPGEPAQRDVKVGVRVCAPLPLR